MKIVLGVTGGIAAYKAVLLARMIVEAGHDLHVVPTEAALRFVGAPTWEAISRNTVTNSVHDDVAQVRHVALGQSADLVIVAPATANTLARMAAGLADDLLGTTLLATRAPVAVAPAMHTEMWEHPATQTNINTLRERGVVVIGPESGRLTGVDSGAGRMSEAETIFATVAETLLSSPDTHDGAVLSDTSRTAYEANTKSTTDTKTEAYDAATETSYGDFSGLHIVITAGGTREPIDPVRYLGNRSSGRQGVALAAAAVSRGARVTLIAANIEVAVLRALDEVRCFGDAGFTVVPVGAAHELGLVVEDAAPDADVIVMAAAVADYRVAEVAAGKIRKEDSGGAPITLELIENPDILVGLVGGKDPHQTVVGFAAETAENDTELLERGRRKLSRKGADLLVVNRVSWDAGFESPQNTIHVLDHTGKRVLRAEGTKREVADDLLDAILVSHLARANL